jgi:hypothetical protein
VLGSKTVSLRANDAYDVSTLVNKPENDTAECIQPVLGSETLTPQLSPFVSVASYPGGAPFLAHASSTRESYGVATMARRHANRVLDNQHRTTVNKGPMGKKHIIVLLITLALAFFHLAEAQQAKKVPWIGYLAGDPQAPTRDSFRQGLKDFGYVEGQSILIEWRFAEDKLDRVLELAAELVRLKLDVIVAGNANAVKALKRTTTTIPIVIAMYAGDPVADGVVTSLAKPG